MLSLNPLLKSSTLLPPSGSTAFYKTVPKDLKPASKEAIENQAVYSVVESQGASDEQAEGGWRGGWAKRFIPDEIVYDTSMQNKETGMLTVTQAPMGVRSSTMWTVREATDTDPVAEDGVAGLVLEVSGTVESNRMLMGFIKTTLQGSYDKLAKDFVVLLEKEVAKKGGGEAPEGTAQKAPVADKIVQPAGDQQVEVEAVA
jgi:hypothetical protein